MSNLQQQILDKFKAGLARPLVFVLIGRTGVGKSSTVNTLMGREVAPVGDFEPTTFKVEKQTVDIDGVTFTLIDTPGLCDDLEEMGRDEAHIKTIQSEVKQVDCLWYVTRLDETRVSADEKRSIRMISQALGTEPWKHAIIVFTFSNNIESAKFKAFLSKRAELIRSEVAQWTNHSIASEVPALAVDNKHKTNPDGKEWLGELYTIVMESIADKGATPFFLATAKRITKESPRQRESVSMWQTQNSVPEIVLDDDQVRRVGKVINYKIVTGAAAAGAAIGATLGPAGAAIGGTIGAGIGLLLSIFG